MFKPEANAQRYHVILRVGLSDITAGDMLLDRKTRVYLGVKLGDLFLVHVGLPVDPALVAELLSKRDKKMK